MTALPLAFLLLSPPQAPTAQEIVANVRKAVQYEAFAQVPQGVMATGRAKIYGETGDYSLLFSRAGEFVEEVNGPISQKRGFDGKTAWESDWTGATRKLHLEDRDEQKSIIAIPTHWWLSETAPFEITVASESLAEDGYTLNLQLKGSPHKQKLLIAKSTWLPVKSTYDSNAGEVVATFSDWRSGSGPLLPHKIEVVEGGVTTTVDLAKVEQAPTFVRNPYEMPSWEVRDTTFDHSLPVEVETKKAFTGHILVHPKVEGKDVGWFILDSGAGAMVIDEKTADDLGMPAIGIVPTVGVGATVQERFRKSKEFSWGRAKIKDLLFVEYDLSAIGNAFGVKLAGIVGYDVFRRCAVEMDNQTPQVRVDDPAKYQLKQGSWLDLILDSRHPIVEASFEGNRKGFFRLDTGADGTVTFHSPYVTEWNLLDGRAVVETLQGGVGGNVAAKMGKIEWFELAGHRFPNPQVTFSLAKVGAFSSRYYVGNIGQEFLKPFVLVFNYPQNKIALVKR